jgi:DNA-binding NarL/FixJ family response regulator
VISVFLADDHDVVRQGLHLILKNAGRFRVVGETNEGGQALILIKQLRPDVAVIDNVMAGKTGLEVAVALRAVKGLDTAVVMLTMHAEESYIARAFEAGIRAYVLKDSTVEELVPAIDMAASGGHYLSKSLTAVRPLSFYLEPPEDRHGPANLTARQVEILQLTAQGLTLKAIAYTLGISSKAVEAQRAKIKAKLGVETTLQLSRYAAEVGLVAAVPARKESTGPQKQNPSRTKS